MTNYQRILVVIDPTRDSQPALDRATHIARSNQAELTLFVSIFDFSYEMTSMLSSAEREVMRNSLVNQRQAWIEELAAPIREQGMTVHTKVAWHNRPYESFIREILLSRHDIIIKSTRQHDKLKAVIFTPTDWHLLRKAPVPVLLVKDHQWKVKGKILVAINVGAEDDDHHSLNNLLMQQALSLASAIDAELHLVNGYPGTPVNIAIELPDFDAHAYNQSLKVHHTSKLQQMAIEHGVGIENCHVIEGLPEDVIPELAQELDAELVVLGTVGRTGLSAALIGNTAEHVIDRLNCDLLAFKPQGFETPVKIV